MSDLVDEAKLRTRLSDEWSFSPAEVDALVALVRESARPVVGEALVTEVVATFHVLHPRIPDLDKGDCHCELLAQLAVDAVLAALTR